jgi:nucleoside phosphorylase
VLVTFAVDAEFAPWRKRHKFRREELDVPLSFRSDCVYTSHIHNVQVDAYLTGIGWTGVKAGMHYLLSKKPSMCISSGLAGGLKPGLRCGEIVAARSVGNTKDTRKVHSRKRLLELAEEGGAKVVDTFITSSQIVSQSQFKKAMGVFADVVEMESFHILNMATGPQVAAVAVRGISDEVDQDLPLDFGKAVGSDGSLSIRQLAIQIGRQPHKIPALVKFGRDSERAAVSLADFLDKYINLVATRSPHWGPIEDQPVVEAS